MTVLRTKGLCTKVTDEDAKAIYAYLKTVKPVSYKPPENQMSFPYSQRFLLTFWKQMFFKPGAYQPDAKQSAEWNRGAYLVQGLAHCGDDAAAKAEVARLMDAIGYDAVDIGTLADSWRCEPGTPVYAWPYVGASRRE